MKSPLEWSILCHYIREKRKCQVDKTKFQQPTSLFLFPPFLFISSCILKLKHDQGKRCENASVLRVFLSKKSLRCHSLHLFSLKKRFRSIFEPSSDQRIRVACRDRDICLFKNSASTSHLNLTGTLVYIMYTTVFDSVQRLWSVLRKNTDTYNIC